MNWKLISAIGVAISGAVFGIVKAVSKRHFDEISEDLATETRDEDVNKQYEVAQHELEKYDELMAKEKAEKTKLVEQWKLDNRFYDRRNEIKNAIHDALGEYLVSINHVGQVDEINDKAKNDIQEFKDSIDYDDKIYELEEKIKEANNFFDSQKRLYDSANDSVANDAAEFRMNAEKARNKAVSEAKAEIKELKSKLAAKEKAVEKVKSEALNSLNSMVNAEKARINKLYEGDLDALNAACFEAKKEATETVEQQRSEAEQLIIAREPSNREYVEQTREYDEARRIDIVENTTTEQAVARWLIDNNCPKWVAGLGFLAPLVPVGYLIWSYVKFAVNTLTAM